MALYNQAYKYLLSLRFLKLRPQWRRALLPLPLLAALSGASGCHGNNQTDASPYVPPEPPANGNDMGSDGLYTWWGVPAVSTSIYSEYTPPLTRNWKRDPHYIADGTDRYLFMAGSPIATSASNFANEQWSISYYRTVVDMDGKEPSIDSFTPWKMALAADATTWFKKDATGPFAQMSAAKGVFWFAGSGASNFPDYVFQIGRANIDATDTSKPPVVNLQGAPVLTAPMFNGTQPDSMPNEQGPDSWGKMDPWVLADTANPSHLIMYYSGLDCSTDVCQFHILRATSTDNGDTFSPGEVVLSGRPGLAIETGGVASPSVIQVDGQYVMAYTAVGIYPEKSRVGIRRALTLDAKIGVAVSTDGIHWRYGSQDKKLLIDYRGGKAIWAASGISAPSLYVKNGDFMAYLGGLIQTFESGSESYYVALGSADVGTF